GRERAQRLGEEHQAVAGRAVHATFADHLTRGGTELLLIDTGSIGSTFDGLRELGRRAGAAAEMDRAVDWAEAGIAGVALAMPVATLPFFGAPGSFLVITKRTWLGDLLDKTIFQNLAAESAGNESFPGCVQVSDEVLASLQPALMLLGRAR
ncbi:MAG: hypothetical protein AB1689_27485, partial [Thermodesulfobacteriota bacterium]